MIRITVLLSVWSAFLLGCAAGIPELTDAERAAIQNEVVAQMSAYWDTWREADFDRSLAFYDDHPDFTMAFNAGTWTSVAAADATFRPFFDPFESQDIVIEEQHIVALARDWAYVTERGSSSVSLRDGSTSRFVFASTHLWVKTDDRWRVRAFHHSTSQSE